MKQSFIIEINDSADNFVRRFDPEFLMVQTTRSRTSAKQFGSEAAATRWINKYVGAGYGVGTFRVVPADEALADAEKRQRLQQQANEAEERRDLANWNRLIREV